MHKILKLKVKQKKMNKEQAFQMINLEKRKKKKERLTLNVQRMISHEQMVWIIRKGQYHKRQ